MSTVKMSYDKDTAIRIKNFLSSNGLTLAGTYGMMANLYTESGFRSNNAQNSCMTKPGMTDETYTAKVDNGEYSNFVFDRVGYGLCQWTSSGRKQNLINHARSCGKSIGDETMQLTFLMQELSTSYRSVLKVLTTSHDISECAKYVMTKFERPANQSKKNQNKRADYGIQLFKELETKNTEQALPKGNNMKYTNSPLVIYTKISPNKTSHRNHVIDTITIHCMAGNLSIERCGDIFAPTTRQASSNYGIGSDGRIAMYVEEKDRSWCTSNKANDHRAITIEVANDGGAPDWHVSDKAMASLIELVADICKRNNIKKLVWSTNKNDRVNHLNGCNMTVHRDYAAKACPGNYLYNKHGYIADEVNKKLSGISYSGQNINVQAINYTYKNTDYSLVFDPVYYSNTYADIKQILGTDRIKLFNHFCIYGMKEGRVASASFNVNKYKSYHADLRNAFGNNLPLYYEHYVKFGYKEKRKCT